MLHSRTLNNKINRIHERALRTVYADYNSSFNELLDKDGYFTIHQRNAQSLAIEIYKYLHGLSPAILSEVFIRPTKQYYIIQECIITYMAEIQIQ